MSRLTLLKMGRITDGYHPKGQGSYDIAKQILGVIRNVEGF